MTSQGSTGLVHSAPKEIGFLPTRFFAFSLLLVCCASALAKDNIRYLAS
jgi:hypothetical protein